VARTKIEQSASKFSFLQKRKIFPRNEKNLRAESLQD